ncbi:MAG: hypothetical protein ACXQT4_00425 [Methanotrichaceae archaeon]
MPALTVYLKNKTYWKLNSEASKYDMTLGKLISQICDNYVEFLEKQEGKKKWQGNTE